MNFDTVIWDWNGTLLNDVDLAINSINKVLNKYKISQISYNQYRDSFTFPVIKYYESIGFDFDKLSFKVVGKEFIDIYNSEFHTCQMFPNAHETLEKIKLLGIKQIIISARFKPSLETDLEHFKIKHLIDEFHAIDNIYAESKEYLFEQFLKQNPDAKVLYIGDTTHDREIAQKFNLKFLLFTQGHQSLKHFQNSNHYTPIHSLSEILNYLK